VTCKTSHSTVFSLILGYLVYVLFARLSKH
jgi:hypothetical protein